MIELILIAAIIYYAVCFPIPALIVVAVIGLLAFCGESKSEELSKEQQEDRQDQINNAYYNNI